MTHVESFAYDMSALAHKAAEAEKRGDSELALSCLEEMKRLHQQVYYYVWNKNHTSGVVK